MAIKDDVVGFLQSDTAIDKVNFEFDGFQVYPSAYKTDIAEAVKKGRIGVRIDTALNEGAGASYDLRYNEFRLPPGFDVSKDDPASLLLHEATHAHMDLQAIGSVPRERSEAIAYVAEAVFRGAKGLPPIGGPSAEGAFMRRQAASMAAGILAGGYKVPGQAAGNLMATLRNEPHYIKQTEDDGPLMPFNGVPGEP
ncbi:hypothetical protein AAFN86_19795 [Roseomonas sp. CAU 1739]|uniref:hypothetical protein n=1 Tax=Roseomonas sp. CAU 1739 TaxID=3140364 RepID=UPI00325B6326